jgi:hypothetical protein
MDYIESEMPQVPRYYESQWREGPRMKKIIEYEPDHWAEFDTEKSALMFSVIDGPYVQGWDGTSHYLFGKQMAEYYLTKNGRWFTVSRGEMFSLLESDALRAFKWNEPEKYREFLNIVVEEA